MLAAFTGRTWRFSSCWISRIVIQPISQFTNAGQTVSPDAVATGQGTLSYQWQLNGTNLAGATGASLVVANAQIANSGDYTLVVTNNLGLINSRPATVTVIEPLTILAQPVSQTVAPGSNVTLTVVATGNPSPIYHGGLTAPSFPGQLTPRSPSPMRSLRMEGTQRGRGHVGAATNSATATVLITSPGWLSRTIADGVGIRIAGASGLGSGNNVGATRETGETNHVGKIGGRSVWLRWLAPATGIATFSTRGSSFDTLLAIYTGPDLASLTPVTADEDSGGYFTSQAAFNAVAGTEYRIAVDGFAGATGTIVLRWSLDPSPVEFPRLLSQPRSLTVLQGGEARFSVRVATSPTAAYATNGFVNAGQLTGPRTTR
jgi:hypothetical protein